MAGLRERRVRRRLLVLIVSSGGLLAGCSGGAQPASNAPPSATAAATTILPSTPASVSPSPSVAASASAVPSPGGLPWGAPIDAALPSAAKLQGAIDGFAGTAGVPGLAAAVVTPNGSWAGAAGIDGAGTKIRPNSAFEIASITKTFVAAELLRLSAAGRIDLDEPVATYVDLPFDAQGATVRQLATMRSGFPGGSDATLATLVAKDLNRVWTTSDVLAWVKSQPRVGTLGGPSAYNGINYHVLAMVMEKVTGESIDTLLRRDLLAPAGLDRIWMQPAERPQPPLTVAVEPASKIVDAKSGFLPSLAAASSGRGGAGMAADAPSLARWGYLLYGGRVIEPNLVATMTSGNPGSGDGYGFGTMLADMGGTIVVGHAGDYMGYSSLMLVWPTTQTAVVVLAPKGGALDPTLPDWTTSLYRIVEGG